MIRFARLGVRLRWTITRNSLRRRGAFLFVLSSLLSVGGALVGFAVLAGSRTMTADQRTTVLTFACSIIAIAWVFGPLLVGGADETVDPRPLSLLPLQPRELGAVLFGAAVSSPATMALEVGLLGGVVAGCSLPLGWLTALLAMLGLFAFGLGLARTVAALMGLAQHTRRGRDITVLVAAVSGVTLWVGSQTIGPILESNTGHRSNVVHLMSWLPPGWAARALVLSHDGKPLAALGWSIGVLLLGAGLLRTWARLSGRLLVGTAQLSRTGRDQHGRLWPRAVDPASAASAKAWRYQMRSPIRRSQMLISLVMSVGLMLLQVVRLDSPDPRIVFMGLTALLFSAASVFNVVGFDSPSLWLEVIATGGFDRSQLRARLVALSPTVAIPVVAGILTVAIATGEWSAVPAALLTVPAAVLCLLGAGAVLSATMPLPAPDGNNPFARTAGENGCSYGLAVLLAMATLGVMLCPIVAPMVLADGAAWGYVTGLGGIVWGWWMWRTGLRLGAAKLLHRGPELLAELSHRAAT